MLYVGNIDEKANNHVELIAMYGKARLIELSIEYRVKARTETIKIIQ